jgi:hypothetical protein
MPTAALAAAITGPSECAAPVVTGQHPKPFTKADKS